VFCGGAKKEGISYLLRVIRQSGSDSSLLTNNESLITDFAVQNLPLAQGKEIPLPQKIRTFFTCLGREGKHFTAIKHTCEPQAKEVGAASAGSEAEKR